MTLKPRQSKLGCLLQAMKSPSNLLPNVSILDTQDILAENRNDFTVDMSDD